MPDRRPVSVTRFERKLRAILGASGSTLLGGVEDHVQGLLVLETDRPEWALAGGERLAWGSEGQGPVAAQFSWVALVNVADSGVLLVLEYFVASNVAEIYRAPRTSVATAAPLLAGELGSGTEFVRDFRDQAQVTAGRMSFGSTAAPPWVLAARNVPANVQFRVPVILEPDSALVVVGDVVNTTQAVDFVWREVPLEGGLLG